MFFFNFITKMDPEYRKNRNLNELRIPATTCITAGVNEA